MYEGWRLEIEYRPVYYQAHWGIRKLENKSIQFCFGNNKVILSWKRV